jgi:hypothetical protein
VHHLQPLTHQLAKFFLHEEVHGLENEKLGKSSRNSEK